MYMFRFTKTNQGFTLVELLVSISIIGILSTIVFASFSQSQAQARDQQRQIALKEVQLALERYHNQNGYYPAPNVPACDVTGFGTAFSGCENYIIGLVPDYLDELPGNADTSYEFKYDAVINSSGNAIEYRFSAMDVEALLVDSYDHPFAYCPRPNGSFCPPDGPPETIYAVYSRYGWGL